MTESKSRSQVTELPDCLPETVHLVNEELENDQVKYHIYVPASTPYAGYSTSSDSFHKPRCGQDGRKRDSTEGLIEVQLIDLLEHLHPGVCRRCLHHMELPQPGTDVMGGNIEVTEDGIELCGGERVERAIGDDHQYHRQ